MARLRSCPATIWRNTGDLDKAKVRYDGELVKGDDEPSRFRTFVIACTWSQGDAAVMSKSDQQKTEESVRKTASQFPAQVFSLVV
ncbi:hypothetical protein AC579_10626 [Pseudocercospora musae]|uniref:Uncharacterized protein n=1 Tax=Pseudocercospora musae TaxID=113226 RepID=A0A139ILE2_9PEZI|nr:hypothetical protein AC579_10626 [Pseudocercospora musae]